MRFNNFQPSSNQNMLMSGDNTGANGMEVEQRMDDGNSEVLKQ